MSNLMVDVRLGGLGHGDGYGFITAQRLIYAALLRMNHAVTITRVAPIELIHISPHRYRKTPGKFSILWATAETHTIPEAQVVQMNQADMIIASCEHNRDVFKSCGVDKPIQICHLGIDTQVWKPERKTRLPKCVFYWEGQKSVRKGWDLIADAFKVAFPSERDVALYIKTTGGDQQTVQMLGDNVTVDTRNLSLADLLDLYDYASAIIVPSRGEGTGLPALQAMAKGLFVIAPSIMGMADFVSEETAVVLPTATVSVSYGCKTKAETTTPEALAEAMRTVYENDGSLHSKIVAGRRLVESKFSLVIMGERLVQILKEVQV